MDKPIYNVEGMRLELLNIKLSIRRAIDNLTEEEMLNEIEASQ